MKSFFVLGANYPNPFNPETIIPYELAATSPVKLEVFNTLGQRMATLVDGEQGAGAYQAQWDGTAAAGLYWAVSVCLRPRLLQEATLYRGMK